MAEDVREFGSNSPAQRSVRAGAQKPNSYQFNQLDLALVEWINIVERTAQHRPAVRVRCRQKNLFLFQPESLLQFDAGAPVDGPWETQ